ncbi:hypothetical protein PMAYCL1PPCAC_07144 [Pristionchus mayeri]|uniref:Uncharacterized protein n=1 Tax=Pristionchus mayeri TaxID=1317129 RepID=A0AAN5CC66_9BILA|nr:hypothetical protein PMAYCL1PPCAC_07144 [Pristionchus mayeri]
MDLLNCPLELDVPIVGANCEVRTSDTEPTNSDINPRTTFDDTLDEFLMKIRAEIAMEELKRRAPPPKDTPAPKRVNGRRSVLNHHPSLLSLSSKDRPLRICKVERPTPPPTPSDFIDNRRYKFSFAVLPPSVPRCDPIKICRPLNPTHSDPLYSTASIKHEVRWSNAMTRSVSSILPFHPGPFCRQNPILIQTTTTSFSDINNSLMGESTSVNTPVERESVAEFFNGESDAEDELIQVD